MEDEDLQSVPLPMRVWSEGEIRCVKDVAAEFNIHVDHVGKVSEFTCKRQSEIEADVISGAEFSWKLWSKLLFAGVKINDCQSA